MMMDDDGGKANGDKLLINKHADKDNNSNEIMAMNRTLSTMFKSINHTT